MVETEDDGQGLEQYWSYLRQLCQSRLGDRLSGKVDLSGVVQETLLEAHRAGDRFSRVSESERIVWLRRVLAFNLTDEVRRLGAVVRDVARERPLDADISCGTWLAADHSSPSQRVAHEELLLRLAAVLSELPEDQRRAVELRHLHGLSLAEVGEQMGRTREAVAGLLFRGLKGLRALLCEEA